MATVIFRRFFAQCLVVSSCKVSNDLDNYLQWYSKFEDCSEPDVHNMTSQVLSILIDFTENLAVPCTIFSIVFQIFKP